MKHDLSPFTISPRTHSIFSSSNELVGWTPLSSETMKKNRLGANCFVDGVGREGEEGTVQFAWCSNWILHWKCRYYICCLIDVILKTVRYLSNSTWNTSISGVKSSWTSLYCRKRRGEGRRVMFGNSAAVAVSLPSSDRAYKFPPSEFLPLLLPEREGV